MPTIVPGMEIRPRRIDDDVQIVDIRNESHPHLPAISVEQYRLQAENGDKEGAVTERFVAARGSQILGLYALSELGFVGRPGTFMGNLGVAVSRRRQGVGGQLFTHLLNRATSRGAERIYGSVFEGDGDAMGFVKAHGFTPTGRAERMSCLKVDKARLDGYAETRRRLEDEGIEIKSVAEAGSENEVLLREVAELVHKSGNDIPSSEKRKAGSFEEWRQAWMDAPDTGPDRMWVALNAGHPVGVAALQMWGDRGAVNRFTGVARDQRGRGIARALKLRTIEYARSSGLEFLLTGNDVDNKRMLDINIRLGYQMLPGEIEIVRELSKG